MKTIEHIFRENHGYARMKFLRANGIQTRDISKALKNGTIEKIKPGVYKLIDYPWDENERFTDICFANKKAVISLVSAAGYWELTTFEPNEITVAVPMNTDKFLLDFPPIRTFYFSPVFYNNGIETISSNNGKFRIYNKEKTICDLFRYEKKIGEDIALEALKNYIQNKNNINIPTLTKFANEAKILTKIQPILKGMLH